jgi:hypothetical protein
MQRLCLEASEKEFLGFEYMVLLGKIHTADSWRVWNEQNRRNRLMTSKLRISAVQPVAGKHAIEIEWSNGKRHTVDLTDHINTFPVLKPLQDLALFGRVDVGEWGFDVTWGNDLELSAVTLHRV